jgi:hypothetical protein
MKKLNDWILPILFILLAISFFFLQNGIVKEYEIKTKFYKSKLGEEFILDKDTLKIVDYNSFEEVFILSDGRKINKEIVK